MNTEDKKMAEIWSGQPEIVRYLPGSHSLKSTSGPIGLRFYVGGTTEVFRVTSDRQFILAPDMSEQKAARLFAEYVSEYMISAAEKGE